jgi:hypothetical protein
MVIAAIVFTPGKHVFRKFWQLDFKKAAAPISIIAVNVGPPPTDRNQAKRLGRTGDASPTDIYLDSARTARDRMPVVSAATS